MNTDKPTEKQIRCIDWIDVTLDIDTDSLDLSTKQKAWQFIHDNIDSAKEKQREYRNYHCDDDPSDYEIDNYVGFSVYDFCG